MLIIQKKAIDDLQDVQGMGRETRDNEAEKRNGPNNRKYNKLNKNDSYFLHSDFFTSKIIDDFEEIGYKFL